MKHMIIRGNVQGGHTIKDLGLTLAFGDEAPIPLQRAGYSRDLSHAIQSKCVIKVGERVLGSAPLPPTARIKPVAVPVKAPRKATPPPPPTKGEKELDELREMNRQLLATLATLTDSQDKLMNKLSEAVDQGLGGQTQTVFVREETVSPNKKAISSVVDPEDPWEDEEDEPVIFIPSKIRSEKTVVSDHNSVEEETKEASDKMDQAAQALSAMNKGRKKRRSKTEG